jgi:hypothetical protein
MSTETSEIPKVERGENSAGKSSAATDSASTQEKPQDPPQFILYLSGPEYGEELRQLTLWVHHVLLPVYGREVTSTAPWCSCWWEHPEAVGQLHGLWLAWAELTGPGSSTCGPANWHRDHLRPVMESLRDPLGPFAGCKPGAHRPKEFPPIDAVDPFGPPPELA